MAALALILTERPRARVLPCSAWRWRSRAIRLVVAVVGGAVAVDDRRQADLSSRHGWRLAAVVGVPLIAGLALSGHGALHSLHRPDQPPGRDRKRRGVDPVRARAPRFSFPQVERPRPHGGCRRRKPAPWRHCSGLWGGRPGRDHRARVEAADPRRLVLGSLAATVVLAAAGKVLSPQYLIWVIPLFALAAAWGYGTLAAALGAAMLLTFIAFPSQFHDVVFLRTPWLVEIGLRNLLLLTAMGLAIRELAVERVPAPAEKRVPDQVSVLPAPAPSPRPSKAFEVIQVFAWQGQSRSGTPWVLLLGGCLLFALSYAVT